LRLDAADARDRRGHAACRRQDRLTRGSRRGEAQLIIVAAGCRVGAAQAGRLGGQHVAGRQRVHVQRSAHVRQLQNVAEVANQPIRNIDCRMGDALPGQQHAQFHARHRRVHAHGSGAQRGVVQRMFLAVAGQRQAGIAQRARNPDVVARLGGAAAQGLARAQLAKHGDADVERAFGGVAADQLDVEGVGQREQALRKTVQPVAVGFRQRQRQREADRARAHRRQVGQVDGQRLVAQPHGIFTGKEVAAFHQHVGRNGGLQAGSGRDQRAVVADAERGADGVVRALEVFLDEVEFREHALL